jgi:hypothetical protein
MLMKNVCIFIYNGAIFITKHVIKLILFDTYK